MRRGFDCPPSVTGYSHLYALDGDTPRSSLSRPSGATAAWAARETLRPVFLFLLTVAVLLPWQLGWLVEERCWIHSDAELVLVRIARGLWIVWLTHAAGLMDEALRVFLGIRLTQGLGTPTSVDRVYSKMSRWAEVVAEGIAVDDFPALKGLYACAQRPRANKRSTSGSMAGGAGGSADGWGPGDSRARVNNSLVMRVERVAATAQLWSLAPWSHVRRYDRVHVKGLTLRLRQVNGILNFSFLALKKKGIRGRAMDPTAGTVGVGAAAAAAVAAEGRRSGGFGGGRGAGGGGWGAPGERRGGGFEGAGRGSGGGGMDDLDGVETDGDVDTDSDEPMCPEHDGGGSTSGSGGEAIEPTRRFSDTASCGPYSSLSGPGLGFGGRRVSPPWAASSTAGSDVRSARAFSSRWSGAGGAGGASRSTRSISNSGTSRGVRSMSLSGRSKRPPPPAENVGNLGIVKVLGEAFLRRFNAYSEQVSAAFDRVSNIKLIPNVWKALPGRGGGWGRQKPTKRYEVREILLEDVCICVDAGVWNDLLGDHVGAVFSPQFCLGVKVGPQELSTANGEGRLAGEIGALLNDKLVRLLARLVMRETLKTSTLTSVVLTSLALDTDARGRRQGKHTTSNSKSPNSPPGEEDVRDREGTERGSLARAVDATSAAFDAAFPAESKPLDNSNKPAKFWKFGPSSSSTAAAAAAAASSSNQLMRGGGSGGGSGGGGESMRVRKSPPFAGASPVSEELTLSGRRQRGAEGISAGRAARGVRERSHSLNNRRRRLHPQQQRRSSSKANGGGGGDGPKDSFDRSRGGVFRDGFYESSEGGSSSVVDGPDGQREGEGGSEGGDRRGVPRSRTSPSPPATATAAAGGGKRGGPWRRKPVPSPGGRSRSPPPLTPSAPAPRSRVRRRASGTALEEDESEGPGQRGRRWFSGQKGPVRRRPIDFAHSDGGGRGGYGGGAVEVDRELESVAKVPPWMEGVQASPEYEEMKPTLDVIKQTVLLAVLHQSNASSDMSGSRADREVNANQNGKSWGRRQGQYLKDEDTLDTHKLVEDSLREELMHARQAGGDVDRLVMKALLARVRESGPNSAFKALASIELSSFLENLAAGTRFAQHLENVGIDAHRVARSLAGLTVGEMMEGVRNKAGKVGGEARRLRAEAVRMQKELLDETGIIPLLNDAGSGGNDASSLAAAFNLLGDALAGTGVGSSASGGSSAFPPDTESWERGVAISNDPWEDGHSVEKGLIRSRNGDLEEMDEVDVIMQVLDLLEAVEGLKVGIMSGDGVALDKVEQAVGKVARGIDVYLILAASESMLGFLLERLGKLPVGTAKFSGKGVEVRVWDLDLGGVHVKRENVDLVMKGFRLPKRGTAVMTQMGPGRIKRYKKRSRCFVVNLDWKMSNGKPVKAYLQPNDIVMLEGHEGRLSDEEEGEENARSGHTKVKVDNSDVDMVVPVPPLDVSGGGAAARRERDPNPSPPLRDSSGGGGGGGGDAPAPRADKGKWPSLHKIWNRRKSSGPFEAGAAQSAALSAAQSAAQSAALSAAQSAAGSGSQSAGALSAGVGEDARTGGVGGSVGSGGGDARLALEQRKMGGRTASAPAIIGPSPLPALSPTLSPKRSPKLLLKLSPKVLETRKSSDGSARASVVSAATPGGAPPGGLRPGGSSAIVSDDDNVSGGGARGGGGGAGESIATAHPSREKLSRGDGNRGEKGGAGGLGRKGRKGGGSSGTIASPTAAEMMSAPFLVARISAVGAELRDVKWSVKQAHFPYLKTAGSLQATLSGLTIELELDTRELPTAGEGKGDCKVEEPGDTPRGTTRGTPRGTPKGAPMDTSKGGPMGAPKGASKGPPKGLRLTRLRVSVLAVKVHVSNNALSAVYNLAASAFEEAVKRYVVESVEAAVRKNVTALLTIVNHQMGEKWNILCKVGGVGGGGGGGGGDGDSGSGSSSGSSSGNLRASGTAVEKVLETSRSHHVVWAAGDAGGGGSNSGNFSSAGADPDAQDVASPSERRDRLISGSSSSKASADGSSEDGDGGARGGINAGGSGSAGEGGGGGGGGGSSLSRQKLVKRSLRKLLATTGGRAQTAEGLSSQPLSASTSPSSAVSTAAAPETSRVFVSSSARLDDLQQLQQHHQQRHQQQRQRRQDQRRQSTDYYSTGVSRLNEDEVPTGHDAAVAKAAGGGDDNEDTPETGSAYVHVSVPGRGAAVVPPPSEVGGSINVTEGYQRGPSSSLSSSEGGRGGGRRETSGGRWMSPHPTADAAPDAAVAAALGMRSGRPGGQVWVTDSLESRSALA